MSQNHETEIKKGQLLLRYLKITVMPTWKRRGESSSKSQGAIRAAGYFWPLYAFRHVESVRKHKTGLKRGQQLLRKLRFTVLVHTRGEEEPD